MKNIQSSTKRLTICALIAAIYAVLCVILAPISYGPIQIRISEAMTVLPFLAPYTGFGLFVGCIIANIFSPMGINLLDVIFGSLATLLSVWLTAKMPNKWLAPLPPVIINAVIIGAVLAFTAGGAAFWPMFIANALQIGFGQLVACYVGGELLLFVAEKTGMKKRF